MGALFPERSSMSVAVGTTQHEKAWGEGPFPPGWGKVRMGVTLLLNSYPVKGDEAA